VIKNRNLEVLGQIEGLIAELKRSLSGGIASKNENPKIRGERGTVYAGLTKVIMDFIDEGFFDAPRKLSDIQSKLRDEGIKKPTTALMRPVLVLIRHKKLARTKPAKGQYLYTKRIGE